MRSGGQLLQAPVRARRSSRWPISRAVLPARPSRINSSSRQQGPSTSRQSQPVELGAHGRRQLLHARQVHQRPAAALVGQAVAHDPSVAPPAPNRPAWWWARRTPGSDSPSAQRYVGAGDHRPPLDQSSGARACEATPTRRTACLCTAGVVWSAQGAGLAQQQQAQRVVELGVGEQHRLQRRRPARRAGAGRGRPRSAVRMSGEALIRNHRRWSALTATDDWVRGRMAAEPSVPRGTPGSRSSTAGEPPPPPSPAPAATSWHSAVVGRSEGGGPDLRSGAARSSKLVVQLGDVHVVTSGATPISSNSGVSHTASCDSMDSPPLCLGSGRLPSRATTTGRAKTIRALPWHGAEHPGQEPSAQPPQPTGTATYCRPSTL